MNYNEKLQEYHSILDFRNRFYGSDFENNYKFFFKYKNQVEKKNYNNPSDIWKKELYQFFQDAIDIHKRVYRHLYN